MECGERKLKKEKSWGKTDIVHVKEVPEMVESTASTHLVFHGNVAMLTRRLPHLRSATFLRWGLTSDRDAGLVSSRTKGQAFRLLANPNVSPGKGDRRNEVVMVDPLEAKRLAAKQLQEIRAKEKFKRRQQIEAINGAWAMIGLTAGLVIESQTGKGILSQLAGYWSAIGHFFVR